MKKNDILRLLAAIAVSHLAGAIGSIFSVRAIGNGWYAGLLKPVLNPPNWVFGPAWIILYTIMGFSAFLIWKKGWEEKNIKKALTIFAFQLFLNAAWSVVFFGLQSLGWALVNIIGLWLAIAWTIIAFYGISKTASYLLAPYLLWVSFALYLNYSIFILN